MQAVVRGVGVRKACTVRYNCSVVIQAVARGMIARMDWVLAIQCRLKRAQVGETAVRVSVGLCDRECTDRSDTQWRLFRLLFDVLQTWSEQLHTLYRRVVYTSIFSNFFSSKHYLYPTNRGS